MNTNILKYTIAFLVGVLLLVPITVGLIVGMLAEGYNEGRQLYAEFVAWLTK